MGVAISGHSLGVVPIDRDGNLLREYTPIWSDKRAKKEAEAFFKSIPYEQWYMTTGNGFPAEPVHVFCAAPDGAVAGGRGSVLCPGKAPSVAAPVDAGGFAGGGGGGRGVYRAAEPARL